MKKILTVCSLTFILSGCVSGGMIQRMEAEDRREARSPCNDPRFLSLQEKPIDSLSMREYDFLRRMEDECAKYRENQNTSSPFGTAIGVTLGVLLTVAVVYVVAHAVQ